MSRCVQDLWPRLSLRRCEYSRWVLRATRGTWARHVVGNLVDACDCVGMTFQAQVVRVLIASPSDVVGERDEIESAIHRWNADHAETSRTVLMPVRWETAATAESGERPQAIVNRQIVDSADVLLGVFWTRLGTATGEAESGTVEEIRRFTAADKSVSLFFSSRPVVADTIDTEQLSALRAFRDEALAKGLVGQFEDVPGLIRQVASALSRIVRERFGVTDAALTAPSAPRAHVTANLVSNRANEYFLVLTNDGGGEAQNVTLRTETGDGTEGWMVMGADEELDFLPPGQSTQYRALVHLGSPQRVNCHVSWTNEDGSQGTSRQTLQL